MMYKSRLSEAVRLIVRTCVLEYLSVFDPTAAVDLLEVQFSLICYYIYLSHILYMYTCILPLTPTGHSRSKWRLRDAIRYACAGDGEVCRIALLSL